MSPESHGNALPVGYRLHWYRIGGVLGQGGFGITYEAFDTNLEKPVAIKEYLPTEFAVREQDTTVRPFTEDRRKMFDWGLSRFLQEARTLAKFHHPNIVLVHNVFEKNGTAYMVMAYEQGETLNQLFKLGRMDSEKDLLRIIHPLLDGLVHVHEAGFIHRDIKPPNIYIRLDGSPVLIDFGSARFAIGGETKALTSLVTPGFAPFEQYNAEAGKQGPWTDIYGLGATLYTAINRGRAPVDAIIRGHARIEGKPDPMEPAVEIGKGRYSETFLLAIDAALGFTPVERPKTVAAWRALFPTLEERPAELKPEIRSEAEIPTVIHKVEKDSERPRGGGISKWLAISVAVLAIAGGIYFVQTWQQSTTLTPEQQQFTSAEQQREVQEAARLALDAEIKRKQQEEQEARLVREAELKKQAVEQQRLTTQVADERVRLEQERARLSAEDAIRRQQARIDELLVRTDKALASSRLTSPAGDNAMEYLQAILKLDADNLQARRGIGRVVSRYLKLAENAGEQGKWGNAKVYIDKADAIEPGAEAVLMARDKLAQQQSDAQMKRNQQTELERKRIEEKNKQIEDAIRLAEKEAFFEGVLPIALVAYGETKKRSVDYTSGKLKLIFEKSLKKMSLNEEIELLASVVEVSLFSEKLYLESGVSLCRSNPVSMIFGIYFDHWMGGKTGDLILAGFDCTTKQYTKRSYAVEFDRSTSKWGPSWKKAVISFVRDTDIFNKVRKAYKGRTYRK